MTAKLKALVCPSCGDCDLDLMNFDSLMVLKPDLGLFTVACPKCNVKVSSIQPIPDKLMPRVHFVAEEINARMGM